MEGSLLLALAHILFVLIVVWLVGMIARRSFQAASFLRPALASDNLSIGTIRPLLPTLFVLVFLITTGIAAAQGTFAEFDRLPPLFAIPVLLMLMTVVVFSFTPLAHRLRAEAPETWFVEFQTFRIVMEIVLWLLFEAGVIPVQMTFEGRNFDILVGLTAPLISYCCFRKRIWPASVAVVWNLLSLGLLLNIVIVALLSTPVPFRVFFNEPANTIISQFPFIWLPAFVVPMAFAGHLFSLRQLLERRKRATVQNESTPIQTAL